MSHVFRPRANYRRSRRRLHVVVQYHFDVPRPPGPVHGEILRRRKRTEHRQPPRFEFEQRAAAKRRARIVPQTDASTTPLLGEVVRRRRRTEHRQPPRFEFEQQAAAKRRAFVPKLVYTPFGAFAIRNGGLIPSQFRGHWSEGL